MSLDIDMIQDSFEKVKPIAVKVVNHFYNILFSENPESKKLFKSVDMRKQEKALIKSLVFIVENLRMPDNLLPYLKKMGARHMRYGVKEVHYDWVGQALIETFAHFFGGSWTPELEKNWILAYEFLVEKILDGYTSTGGPLKAPEKSIEHLAKDLAKQLLRHSLNVEIEKEFLEVAREKARTILKKSLEVEASLAMSTRRKAS